MFRALLLALPNTPGQTGPLEKVLISQVGVLALGQQKPLLVLRFTASRISFPILDYFLQAHQFYDLFSFLSENVDLIPKFWRFFIEIRYAGFFCACCVMNKRSTHQCSRS